MIPENYEAKWHAWLVNCSLKNIESCLNIKLFFQVVIVLLLCVTLTSAQGPRSILRPGASHVTSQLSPCHTVAHSRNRCCMSCNYRFHACEQQCLGGNGRPISNDDDWRLCVLNTLRSLFSLFFSQIGKHKMQKLQKLGRITIICLNWHSYINNNVYDAKIMMFVSMFVSTNHNR